MAVDTACLLSAANAEGVSKALVPAEEQNAQELYGRGLEAIEPLLRDGRVLEARVVATVKGMGGSIRFEGVVAALAAEGVEVPPLAEDGEAIVRRIAGRIKGLGRECYEATRVTVVDRSADPYRPVRREEPGAVVSSVPRRARDRASHRDRQRGVSRARVSRGSPDDDGEPAPDPAEEFTARRLAAIAHAAVCEVGRANLTPETFRRAVLTQYPLLDGGLLLRAYDSLPEFTLAMAARNQRAEVERVRRAAA